ncbi:MAG: hypothetical protein ACYCPT_13575, partial [Acidimicrobiales bacterium]
KLNKCIGHFNIKNDNALLDDSIVLAGGLITKLLLKNCTNEHIKASDIDLYLIANIQNNTTIFDKIIANNTGKNSFYSLNGGICTIYKNKCQHKMQLIVMAQENTAFSIIDSYDFDALHWIYTNEGTKATLRGLPDAILAFKKMQTNYFWNPRSKVSRIIKMMKLGFDIKMEYKIAAKEFDALYNDDERMRQQIRLLNHWYYPNIDENELDLDMSKATIDCALNSIQQIEDAPCVTQKPPTMNNISAIDNINKYWMPAYTLYNVDMMHNSITYKSYNNDKPIKLVSGEMTVLFDEQQKAYIFKFTDKKFAEFLQKLYKEKYNVLCTCN